MTSTEHDSALRRFEAALDEHARLSDSYEAAFGTSTELGAYARLCAGREQVAAREAWLHWVDDEHYRGLDAGALAHLAQNADRPHEAVQATAEESARLALQIEGGDPD